MNQEQIRKLVESNFSQFDRNGDGYLELQEFVDLVNATYRRMGIGTTTTLQHAEQTMSKIDFDKNNLISKAELYKAYKNFCGFL